MSVLLVVDMLGTRARWRAGAAAAARAFATFHQLVTDTAATIEAAPDLVGELDADWCAIPAARTRSRLWPWPGACSAAPGSRRACRTIRARGCAAPSAPAARRRGRGTSRTSANCRVCAA